MTDDPVRDFLAELDQFCNRHGLWLDTGGLDGLVRVSPERLGAYIGRSIDDGDPILCSLPFEAVMGGKKEERDRIVIDAAIRGGCPTI